MQRLYNENNYEWLFWTHCYLWGIAGLSLGCFLLRKDIKPIIFERSSKIREGGAGISISPNAINLLDKINLKENLSNEGFFPENKFLDEDHPIIPLTQEFVVFREKTREYSTQEIYWAWRKNYFWSWICFIWLRQQNP